MSFEFIKVTDSNSSGLDSVLLEDIVLVNLLLALLRCYDEARFSLIDLLKYHLRKR